MLPPLRAVSPRGACSGLAQSTAIGFRSRFRVVDRPADAPWRRAGAPAAVCRTPGGLGITAFAEDAEGWTRPGGRLAWADGPWSDPRGPWWRNLRALTLEAEKQREQV